MSILPPPADASRVSRFLADHPRWSVYWNKKHGLWCVAEDDPDSDLYAESSDADTVVDECDRVTAAGSPLGEHLQGRPQGLRDFRILDLAGYYLRITDRVR